MTDHDPIITIRDVIEDWTCRPQLRAKVDLLGLDFEKLRTEGYRVSEVKDIDDHHVQHVVSKVLGKGAG